MCGGGGQGEGMCNGMCNVTVRKNNIYKGSKAGEIVGFEELGPE